MYLIVSLAAAAAALVLLYNRRREGGEDLTESWVGRAQQLAAVVLVLTQAVEGLLEALDHASGHRPVPAFAGSRMNVFDEEDWR